MFAYLLKLKLRFERDIKIPKYYNHTLQWFFYQNMDKLMAEFYHNSGFVHGSRTFKLFTFSKVFGKLKAEVDNYLIYSRPSINVYFATPIERTIRSVIKQTIQKPILTLYRNALSLCEVDVIEQTLEEEVQVLCLSPIVVYKTPRNSTRHVYLSPFQEEFYQLLKKNLFKKYELVYGKSYEGELEIIPVRLKENYKRKVLFKTTLITAWEGVFKISAQKDMIKVALECGLGVKNSAGFGCIIKVGGKHAEGS